MCPRWDKTYRELALEREMHLSGLYNCPHKLRKFPMEFSIPPVKVIKQGGHEAGVALKP